MGREKIFLIVGGSRSHTPFIEAAHKLGFLVGIFDQNPKCIGSEYCDYFYQISTHDQGKIVEKCIEIDNNFELLGIMTYSAYDMALKAVSQACSLFDLPCFSVDCIDKITDKKLMRQSLLDGGIPMAEGIVAKNSSEAVVFFKRVGPVILKPSIGGRGSKGVALCNSESAIVEYFSNLEDNFREIGVIVEKYYGGSEYSEYSVDGIIIGDKPIVLAISKKSNLGESSNFIMSGFLTDFSFKNKREGRILERIGIDSALSLGVSNSFFSVDVLLNDSDKTVVLECGVLLDCKIDRLLYFSGIDIYRLFVQMAVNLPSLAPNLEDRPSVALSFMFSDREGFIIRKGEIKKRNVLLEWEGEEGRKVQPPRSISDAIGWIITTGEDSNVAYSYAQKIRQSELYDVVI